MQVLDIYNKITDSSNEIGVSTLQETRFVDKIQPGQFVRQGDIYIVCVKSVNPKLKETKVRQLAMGNSQGSRHVIEGEAEIFAPVSKTIQRTKLGEYFEGPSFRCKEHVTISHPEHAHISLPPGSYEVRHQVDLLTKKRVID